MELLSILEDRIIIGFTLKLIKGHAPNAGINLESAHPK